MYAWHVYVRLELARNEPRRTTSSTSADLHGARQSWSINARAERAEENHEFTLGRCTRGLIIVFHMLVPECAEGNHEFTLGRCTRGIGTEPGTKFKFF